VLYKYVPRDHVDRPKQGFGIPLHHWLTGDMRILIDQYLEPGVIASQGVFDPGVVRRLLALFHAGSRAAVQKVWLLLAFQMWHARWMSV
jgi:asparagine synthase (glutamine-hydrolysing)